MLAALLALCAPGRPVVCCVGRHQRSVEPSRPLRIAGRPRADRAPPRRRRNGHHHRRGRQRLARQHVRLSRPRPDGVAVAAAARHSDLHRGLCLCRSPRYARTGPIRTARNIRLGRGRPLLVPGSPLSRWGDLRYRLRALSLRLPRGAGDVSSPGGAAQRAGAHARGATMAAGATDHPAAGAARHCGRDRAGAARDRQ